MKNSMKFFTLSLLIMCFIPNTGRTEESLTWADCVKESLQNHPDLITAREVVNQYKAQKLTAISAALPQISTEVSQSTSKVPPSNQTNTSYQTNTSFYGISGQQLLFDGLKTPYNIASAAKNVTAAQYNYDVTSSNIRLRLRTAFVALLSAQELLTITQDIAQRRKQNADLVKLLYEGGMENRGSLLTAEADLAQAESNVVQAERAIIVAQRQLSKEIGRAEVSPIRATGSLEVTTVKQEKPNFEELATTNPALENLSALTEAAQYSLKSAKAEFFPTISANASAGRTDSVWPPHQDEWSAGVTLALPIFDGFSRWADVSKARALLNQAKATERSSRDGIILTLEQAWAAWQNAIDTAAVQKQVLQAADERAKISRVEYTNGLITFDNWTIIEDNLAQAQTSLLTAEANAFVAEAQWIQAKGGTLEYAE